MSISGEEKKSLILENGYLIKIIHSFPVTSNVKRTAQFSEINEPKPILQWVGGKRELIKQYSKYFPTTYNTYWEPFLGGGAIFFYLNPKSSVINDINKELIVTYKAIRDNPQGVVFILEELRNKHSKELYLKVRSIDREINILFKDYILSKLKGDI